MDRDYIETHNVIERYHLGRLSEEEASAFEDLFVFDKELRDEVELAEKFVQGFQGKKERDMGAGGAIDAPPLAAAKNSLGPDSPAGEVVHAKGPKTYGLNLAIAASVLLGVTSAFLFMQNRDLVQQQRSSISQINPPSLHLEVYRNADRPVPVLAAGGGVVTFLIDSSGSGPGPHRLRLTESDGSAVVETEAFEIDPTDPWIEWLVDRQVLQPTSYRVELLSGTGPASTPVSSFSFAVTRDDRPTAESPTE